MMRLYLLTAAVTLSLLGGCRQSAGDSSNTATANDGGAALAADNGAAPGAAAPLGKEQALAVMHERHEGMEQIGKATKTIGRELKGGSPDLAVVRASAAKLSELATHSAGWFANGTGPDVGKTGAKPEIWQKPADFAAKLKSFQQAAPMFEAAAKGGDINAIKASFGEVGKTCKACHDSYRKEMHH